jgi:hypothetical protein
MNGRPNQSLQPTAGLRDAQISLVLVPIAGKNRSSFPVDAGRDLGLDGSSGGHLWLLLLCTSSAA